LDGNPPCGAYAKSSANAMHPAVNTMKVSLEEAVEVI